MKLRLTNTHSQSCCMRSRTSVHPPLEGNTVRRAILATLLTLTWLFVPMTPGSACSCLARSPQEIVATADAAFIGVLLGESPQSGPDTSAQGQITLSFRVESVVKGDLRELIDVRSNQDAESCGLGGYPTGLRLGLAVSNIDGQWEGSTCDVMDPDMLLGDFTLAPPASATTTLPTDEVAPTSTFAQTPSTALQATPTSDVPSSPSNTSLGYWPVLGVLLLIGGSIVAIGFGRSRRSPH